MTPPKRLCRLPPGGNRQRPGKAGSAAVAWLYRIHASWVPMGAMEN
jgi:hypothetical protein